MGRTRPKTKGRKGFGPAGKKKRKRYGGKRKGLAGGPVSKENEGKEKKKRKRDFLCPEN